MYKENTFEGKVALVTGGRSGIGYCIAKTMLQLGAKVIIISRKEEELKAACNELSEFGDCGYVPCDIKDTEQIQKVTAYIKEKFGKLDILVNNAGGQFPALAEYISDKGWSAVINNNLNGTFFMTRDMAKAFFIPQKEGIVVNIIVDLYRGFPGMVHTGAARAGVENMTKTLAQEWSDYNIRLNCIAPGIIESSGLDTYPKPVQDQLDKARKSVPMKRFGKAEDIANAVCFLASPLSAYTTGTTLYVDGAQHLNFDKMGLPNVLKSFM
jgi:NAD(P)-dependent dehydrogenase (short-subunit alcohol dehydrogenase family)